MKFLFVILLVCGVCPSFALGDDTEEGQCSFDLTVTGGRAFSERDLADRWCGSVHKLFGFERSCYVRRHNDGRWFSDFRHQRRFQGSSYDGIFRAYTQWSDRHLFRGAQFQHQIRFSSKCFGRGNSGGGGY